MNSNPYQPPDTDQPLANVTAKRWSRPRWLVALLISGFAIGTLQSLRYFLTSFYDEEFVMAALLSLVTFVLLLRVFPEPVWKAIGFYSSGSAVLWMGAVAGYYLADPRYSATLDVAIVIWAVLTLVGAMILAIRHLLVPGS